MTRWIHLDGCSIAFAALLCVAPPLASAQVLYDPGLNSLPAAQGWLYLTSPFVGALSTQSLAAGPPAWLVLDTTPDAGFTEKAGYFGVPHPLAMLLDRSAGFTLTLDLRLAAEAHAPRDDNGDGLFDRAGFSVIVITHDLLGIELGWWPDRVWAYDDDLDGPLELFTQAEGVGLDTAVRVRYSLVIAGLSYSLRVRPLSASGAALGPAAGEEILNGRLRDYRAFTGSPDVYEFPDFLFLGDDTSSAEGRAEIGAVTLGPALPPRCAGDASGDGVVGLPDIARLIELWSLAAPPADTAADLDADGTIGIGDLARVIGAWGSSCG